MDDGSGRLGQFLGPGLCAVELEKVGGEVEIGLLVEVFGRKPADGLCDAVGEFSGGAGGPAGEEYWTGEWRDGLSHVLGIGAGDEGRGVAVDAGRHIGHATRLRLLGGEYGYGFGGLRGKEKQAARSKQGDDSFHWLYSKLPGNPGPNGEIAEEDALGLTVQDRKSVV